MRIWWMLSVAGAVFGAFCLIVLLPFGESAPTEAAICALAAAAAIVPYCFARAMAELKRLKE